MRALCIPLACIALAVTAPATGRDRSEELAPYLQCAPYARQVSGIDIYGDARSWWEQAQGRYATGQTPRVGAVMTFTPHRSMQLGHVATVSKVIDSRRVLIDHANWSPVNGRRGQVEKDVLVVDASPANDWSEVQVWYAPIGDVGTTRWPISGFIYPDKAPAARAPIAAAPPPPRRESSKAFISAFAEYSQ